MKLRSETKHTQLNALGTSVVTVLDAIGFTQVKAFL